MFHVEFKDGRDYRLFESRPTAEDLGVPEDQFTVEEVSEPHDDLLWALKVVHKEASKGLPYVDDTTTPTSCELKVALDRVLEFIKSA